MDFIAELIRDWLSGYNVLYGAWQKKGFTITAPYEYDSRYMEARRGEHLVSVSGDTASYYGPLGDNDLSYRKMARFLTDNV